jgi:hypothetical protein
MCRKITAILMVLLFAFAVVYADSSRTQDRADGETEKGMRAQKKASELTKEAARYQEKATKHFKKAERLNKQADRERKAENEAAARKEKYGY